MKEKLMGLTAHITLDIIQRDTFVADFTAVYNRIADMDSYADFKWNITAVNSLDGLHISDRMQHITSYMDHVNMDRCKAYPDAFRDLQTAAAYINTVLFAGKNYMLAAIAYYAAMGKTIQRFKFGDTQNEILMYNHTDCVIMKDTYRAFKTLEKRFVIEDVKPAHTMTLTWKNGGMDLDLTALLPCTSKQLDTIIRLIREKSRTPYIHMLYLQSVICEMIESRSYTLTEKAKLQALAGRLDDRMYTEIGSGNISELNGIRYYKVS